MQPQYVIILKPVAAKGFKIFFLSCNLLLRTSLHDK